MIQPTVGRIVWYHAGVNDLPGTDGGDQPLAAIISHVWSDTRVNLAVFSANGVPESRTSVLLVQEGNVRPGIGPFCEWMPYQKGQAAKTEALQEQIGEAAD